MSQFVSPGTYVIERDFSDYVAALQQTALGLVGTAKRGPLDKPTLCTSSEDFLSVFGEPSPNHYGPYSALNYLREGNRLLYVRVARKFSLGAANIVSFEPANSNGDIFEFEVGSGEAADFSVGDYIRIRETGKATTVARITTIIGEQITVASPLLAIYSPSIGSDTVVDHSADEIGASQSEVFGYGRWNGSHTPLVHFRAKDPGDFANFGTRQGIEVVIEDGGQFANVDPITNNVVEDASGNPLQGIVPSVPSVDTTLELFQLAAPTVTVGQTRGVNYSAAASRVTDITGNGTSVTATVVSTVGINVGDEVTISGLATATDYNGTFTVVTVPNATSFTFADPGLGQNETPTIDQAYAVNNDSAHTGFVYRCTAARSTGSDWVVAGLLTKRVKVFYQGRQVEVFDNIVGYDPLSEYYWDRVIGTEESPVSDYIVAEYLQSNETSGSQPINSFHNTKHPNNPRYLMGVDTGIRVTDDSNAAFVTFRNGKGYNGENPTNADYIGLTEEDGTTTGLQHFRVVETYDVNMVAVSGVSSAAVNNALLELGRFRNDCLVLIDPPFGLNKQEAVDWHNGTGVYTSSHSAFTGSQGALYWPWQEQFDPYSNSNVWLPPSAYVPGAIAYNDFVSDIWFAPAGIVRGKLPLVLRPERVVTQADVETFYGPGDGNAINPIQVFARDGVCIYGQRTLQRTPSALDRINVRRLLFFIQKTVAASTRRLNFEQNDPILWGQFRAIVEPFLSQLKGQRALEWFRVVCDESTNTPQRRNNNEVYAKMFLIPVKSAEKLILDFTLLPSGAQVDQFIARDSGQNTNQ